MHSTLHRLCTQPQKWRQDAAFFPESLNCGLIIYFFLRGLIHNNHAKQGDLPIFGRAPVCLVKYCTVLTDCMSLVRVMRMGGYGVYMYILHTCSPRQFRGQIFIPQ